MQFPKESRIGTITVHFGLGKPGTALVLRVQRGFRGERGDVCTGSAKHQANHRLVCIPIVSIGTFRGPTYPHWLEVSWTGLEDAGRVDRHRSRGADQGRKQARLARVGPPLAPLFDAFDLSWTSARALISFVPTPALSGRDAPADPSRPVLVVHAAPPPRPPPGPR